MNMLKANNLMLVGVTALVALATAPLHAEDKAIQNKVAVQDEKPVAGSFDSRIDTWVAGVVAKLDGEGPKLTVAGHKLPYATAYAGMLNDIATKTAGLDAAKKAEKEKEVRLSWQDKLNKAAQEQPGSDTNYNCKLPSQGTLVVKNEESAGDLEFLHKDKGIAAVPARNNQEEAKMEPNKSSDQKQDNALGAFSQLKIGDKVYLGYASGILNNEAYEIIKCEKLDKK